MAYICLEELEKILPVILDQWIDKDDEGWKWIFQEIEQKCPVGKRLKGKKWRKKLDSMVETHSTVLSAHRHDINELTKKVDELNNRINILNERHVDLTSRVNRVYSDVTAAKSMAQTAMCRTEVDYTKCSQNNKEKYDQPITAANKCGSCKHLSKQPIDQPCIGCCYNGMNISGMDKWEAKENE